MSHAFFVSVIAATLEEKTSDRYAEFCAMTVYRLAKSHAEQSEPEVHMLLEGFDAHVRTKTMPVF